MFISYKFFTWLIWYLVGLNMAHLHYRLVCGYSDLIGRSYILHGVDNNFMIKSRLGNNIFNVNMV